MSPLFGGKHSEEARQKMSEAKKGKKRPPRSAETRRKISESEKGKIVGEETRKKLSEINKGKKQSQETIARRVEKLKGLKHPPRSEESRAKYRESAKKRWSDPEYRKYMIEVHLGQNPTKETIEKRNAKIIGQQRSPRTKKNCAYCGKELILVEGEKSRKFCSLACKGKWQSENALADKSSHWQGGNITKNCLECGKEFGVEKNRIEAAKFCSVSCKGSWM